MYGKYYKTVRKTALKILNFKADRYYTTASDLKKLGLIYSINVGERRRIFKNWSSLPKIAIFVINYRESSNTWHWVVFLITVNEQYVLDSLIRVKSEKSTDLNRISKKY